MKKNIFTIALAIAALCGLPAAAQTAKPANECPAKECAAPACDNTSCVRKDKGQRPDPFAGITLTEQQKAALDSLKPDKCDKAVANKAENANKQRPDRRQARRDYINGVKNILTPEQYVVFLENIVVESPAPQHAAKHDKFNKKDLRRDGKKMQRVEARHDFGKKK
ncbi:MAG: hypothetical protein J6B13_05080 [Muribaculaceae bacterium]|nr:hypothetical protein [Muribaculaceae bacterium]